MNILELLNLTPEQIASSGDYTPGEGRKKDIGDWTGDAVMSLLTGRNYSKEVEDASRTKRGEALVRKFGSDIDSVSGLTGYKPMPGEDGLADMEESEINRELKRRGRTKTALDQAVLSGVDVEKLAGLTDPTAILSTASQLNKDEKQGEVERLEQKALEREGRNRTEAAAIRNHTTTESNNQRAHDASEAHKLRTFNAQQETARLAHTANQNNLTRQYQADIAKYNAETKIKLGMMDSADRRADRNARREDRLALQRQNSIAQLIKGLTQLGAGMAI